MGPGDGRQRPAPGFVVGPANPDQAVPCHASWPARITAVSMPVQSSHSGPTNQDQPIGAGEGVMQDIYEDFDPMIFRLWEAPQRYTRAGDTDPQDHGLASLATAPEMKSAAGAPLENPVAGDLARGHPAPTNPAPHDPAEQFRLLLNEMTDEMRDQFSTFRSLRRTAERLLSDGDETAQKLARADVKAATDAMGLIVRTLEKVDALQRQLSLDRERAAEDAADLAGFEGARARFLSMIEDRANAKAQALYTAWQRDGPPTAQPGNQPGSETGGAATWASAESGKQPTDPPAQ